MTTALYAPLPLPLDRLRPGVGLLVVALHVGLLWLANLYWPLQSVLFSAVKNTAQSITVQILQKTANRNTADAADNAALNANQQAISNPSRQRFGRAETMLELPAPQTEVSTPLASTVQTVQTAQTAQIAPTAKAEPASPAKAAPAPAPSLPVAAAEPAPQRSAPSVPAAPASPTQRSIEEKPPEPALLPALSPAPPVANTVPPPLVNTVPTSVPTSVPPAAAPSVAVAAPVPAPLVVAAPSLSPAANGASANSASTAASGAAASAGSAASGSAPTGINAPLNLNLPPRYIYRPPVYVPRRSLSEMANDQLRRKPRDPFAEGIEGAGNIDCLKDTPDGPAQGLLAIGPLLKRAIEEKCRK
jgi:hypothetical protein